MTARRFLVYRATNASNGRAYIGITTRPLAIRWRQHVRDALTGGRYPFHRAIRQFGADAFRVEVLRECQSFEEMNAAEIELIEQHSTLVPKGYNATRGGRSNLGRIESPEQRATKSESLKRAHANDPSIAARISATRTGRFAGPKSHWFGARHSEQTLAKMRAAALARYANPATRQRTADAIRALHADPVRHAIWLQKVRAKWSRHQATVKE